MPVGLVVVMMAGMNGTKREKRTNPDGTEYEVDVFDVEAAPSEQREMVWRQAFVSMLAVESYSIKGAAEMADEALIEWKKRWQR